MIGGQLISIVTGITRVSALRDMFVMATGYRSWHQCAVVTHCAGWTSVAPCPISMTNAGTTRVSVVKISTRIAAVKGDDARGIKRAISVTLSSRSIGMATRTIHIFGQMSGMTASGRIRGKDTRIVMTRGTLRTCVPPPWLAAAMANGGTAFSNIVKISVGVTAVKGDDVCPI